MQEHAGLFPTTLHCELGPQGDGTHGFPLGTSIGRSKSEMIACKIGRKNR